LRPSPPKRQVTGVSTAKTLSMGMSIPTPDAKRFLPLQFAYNTARHEGIGYTPAYLNHGRELARPHLNDRRHAENIVPHITRRRLEEAFEVVRINQARAFQKQEMHYNLRRRDWRPRVGQKVWKREYPLSNKAAGFNAKFAPQYVGLLEVRRIVSPVIVDLRDSWGRWRRHVHVQDLKNVPVSIL